MAFPETLVAVALVLSVTSVVKEFARRRGSLDRQELLGEIRALRDEMRQLRQQNNDVILGIDSSLHRIDQRVAHLESRPLSATASTGPEAVPVRQR